MSFKVGHRKGIGVSIRVRVISTGISVGLSVCQAILASSSSPVLLLLLYKRSDPKINSDTSERCEVAHCTPPPPLSITISLSHTFSLCVSRSVFLYGPHLGKSNTRRNRQIHRPHKHCSSTHLLPLSPSVPFLTPPTRTPTHGTIHRPQMSLAHALTWFHKPKKPYGPMQVRSYSMTYEQAPWSL